MRTVRSEKTIILHHREIKQGERVLYLRLTKKEFGFDLLPVVNIVELDPEAVTILVGWMIFHARLCYRIWKLPF